MPDCRCILTARDVGAQERNENASRTAAGLTPIYRVTAPSISSCRSAISIAVDRHAKIDFGGTALMAASPRGGQGVEGKKGYKGSNCDFRDLPAAEFGADTSRTFCGPSP